MAKRAGDRWIIWSQHWVGYKARRWDTCYSQAEAEERVAKLNASPSAEWYHYSVEYRSAKEA